MKSMVLGGITGVLALSAALAPSSAGPAPKNARNVPAGVRIEYVRPERFSDFRLSRETVPDTARIFSREISAALQPTLARLAPGGSLTLRFNDIHLAGRFEPWRGPQLDNVRFVRESSTPIRMQFDYVLTDARGKVISSGSQNLSDTYYLNRYPDALTQSSYDQLFFEKRLLQGWLNGIARS
jgi:Protein of unknown function (DUF3016)